MFKLFQEYVPHPSPSAKSHDSMARPRIIRDSLPLSFKNFKSTRIILDCAETVIEKQNLILEDT